MNAKHEESAMKFWKRNCHGTMATLVVVMFGLSACDEAVTDLAEDTVGQEGAVADVDGLLAGVTEPSSTVR
jgi:hypothetical protein